MNLLQELVERLTRERSGEVVKIKIWEINPKTNHGYLTEPLKHGRLVFTEDGVGRLISTSQTGSSITVRLNGEKRVRTYCSANVYILRIRDKRSTEEIEISPAFYDHLVNSINKPIKYKVSRRKQKKALLPERIAKKLEPISLISKTRGGYIKYISKLSI